MKNVGKEVFLLLAFCLALTAPCSSNEAGPASPEVRIWLSSWNEETKNADIKAVSINHAPYSLSEHGAPGNIRFLPKEGEDMLPEKTLGSGLYTAAYFGCVIRGKPWLASSWHLSETPQAEWSDHEASLVLALIASAEGEVLPEDMLVFGRINPDCTLQNVDHIKERLSAGLQKGIRKFVLPVTQTVIGEGDDMVNLASWVESQGAECYRVKSLSDLTGLFLKSCKQINEPGENPENKMEADPGLNRSFTRLLKKCKGHLVRPLVVPEWQQSNKTELESYRAEAEENCRLGILAYQAGLTYPAYEQLRKSEARLVALEAITRLTQPPESSGYETRMQKLLQDIQGMVKIQPDADITSSKALFFLETGDELTGLKDRVESTFNAVKKMKAAGSNVDQDEKAGAVLRWIFAIESVSQEIKTLPVDGQNLFGSVEGPAVFETEWRVNSFLDLASLAYADLTESFFYRIPKRSDENSRKGLLHNAAFVTTLKNARENHIENLTWYSGLPQDLLERRERNLIESQFIPGTGYSPQDNVAFEAPRKKSDAGNKLISLLNQYSRSAETAYQLKTAGNNPQTASLADGQEPGDLLRLQEIAEEQALRSITHLKKMNIDSNVPSIIYYRAFVLGRSHREEMKIESLRQYWRCTLISDALSVLSYTPAASVVGPAEETEQKAPAPLPSETTVSRIP